MKYLITILFVLLTTYSYAVEAPPAGWRYPVESDIQGGWKGFGKLFSKTYYHAKADFNGDGQVDNAWILFKLDNIKWGLFVFLGNKNGQSDIIMLRENDASSQPAQSMGIYVTEPRYHKSACAKGYGLECREDELKGVDLKLPGLDYFRFESAGSIFFWDIKSESFQRVWTSD